MLSRGIKIQTLLKRFPPCPSPAPGAYEPAGRGYECKARISHPSVFECVAREQGVQAVLARVRGVTPWLKPDLSVNH